MSGTSRLRSIAVIFSVLSFGIGAAPLLAQDDWRQVQHPGLDSLFMNLAADFPVTQQVYLEPVSVWYPSNSNEAADRADALRTDAANQLTSAFIANQIDVIDSSTSGSIIVRVQLIDFTATPASAEALQWQRRFRFNVEPGRLTIVAELIDADTGNAVLRLADMQDESSEGLVDDLRAVLNGWSQVLAQSIASPATDVQLASR
ncbi:MAG: hypothetical protein AAGL69_12555 [Pseudomonadota bacterium]